MQADPADDEPQVREADIDQRDDGRMPLHGLEAQADGGGVGEGLLRVLELPTISLSFISYLSWCDDDWPGGGYRPHRAASFGAPHRCGRRRPAAGKALRSRKPRRVCFDWLGIIAAPVRHRPPTGFDPGSDQSRKPGRDELEISSC